jgi:signal transduction histidine kinase
LNNNNLSRTAVILLIGVVGATLLALAIAAFGLRAPTGDIIDLLRLLSISGAASLAIGLISYRLGWWRRLHSLRWAVLLGHLLALLLIYINVWLAAQRMFISEHDLSLAGLLLVFAGAVAIAFGYTLALGVTDSLRKVAQGAGAIAQGQLATRVPVEGNDEVAALAAEFNRMAAQLEEMETMRRQLDAARRDLIAWASHDLRTPLASIRAMIEALVDDLVTDPETVQRYRRQILAEVRHLSALIDDLFELAQIDVGYLELHFEASSLSDLISDTLESLRAWAERKGIHLSGEVQPGVDPVWMAPDKVQRVLSNLLSNAVQHTPPEGKVWIEARLADRHVQVEVCDTGEGIGPLDLPYVFDRFYRGGTSRSRSNGGAGLGLAIAKGLVEAHGGQIWVESEPRKETRFLFTLPKHQTPDVKRRT